MHDKMLCVLQELCEKVGNNGMIAVGTTAYNANEFLYDYAKKPTLAVGVG